MEGLSMLKKITRMVLLFSLLNTALYQPVRGCFNFTKALWIGLGCAAAAVAVGAYQWQKSETQQVKSKGAIENFNKERDLDALLKLHASNSLTILGRNMSVEELRAHYTKEVFSGKYSDLKIKVVYDGKVLAGFIMYSVDKGTDYSTGRIDLLCVSTEARKKGYAVYLFSKVRDEFFSKGINTISLSVFNKNIPALSLYKKLGFVIPEKPDRSDFYRCTLTKSSFTQACFNLYYSCVTTLSTLCKNNLSRR